MAEFIDELWLRIPVTAFSADSPGDPSEPQPGFPQTGPEFYYEYRTIPLRRPMPRDIAALVYDLTVKFKRGASVAKTIKLGDSPSWKGRPDPVAALTALEGQPDTEAIVKRRRNLTFESQEEFGFNDGLEGGSPAVGIYPPFTIGFAADHWKEGSVVLPDLPGKFDLAVETDNLFFEPFDTSDTTNFKVTSEPLYSAPEVTMLPKIESRKDNYVLLIPQWWKFTITFDAWVYFLWASPDHRIGRQKPFTSTPAPTLALAGTGAGNVDNGVHYYAISWVTNAVETKAGDKISITVINKTTNGKVRITNIPVGPDGTIARKIYRTISNEVVTEDLRDDFFLLATVSNNNFGEQFIDNVADASLGAAALSEYPFPFGNSKVNDWFFAPDGDSFNIESGGDPPVFKDPGFYWCNTAPGATWADWTFCSATATVPPSSACFNYDKIRYRLAQAKKTCTIVGYKKALCRPVFPEKTLEYSQTAISPAFPKDAVTYIDFIPFETENVFAETTPPAMLTDDYESIVITSELSDPEAKRALAWWAENCTAYREYFTDGRYQDQLLGNVFTLIASVDGSFNPNLITGSGDHNFLEPASLGTGAPSHWWSANGKLKVERANTPAGSLVGALQITKGETQNRFYIWRKTASVGRDTLIVDNVPFASQEQMTYAGLSGQAYIPRQRIRSSSAPPPDSGIVWGYNF